MVTSGWPNQCSLLPTFLKPFWSVKDFISIDDGILLKGNRIIIPPKPQGDVLNQLHNHSHQCISNTRFLAQKCVYWPNIDKDIESIVGHCIICNTYVNSLPPEPMHKRDLPSSPWEILGTDLFDYNGQKYLVVCDYCSKFPILRRLSGESTKVRVKHLKQISEHGIPGILYSDNGPCYSSEEFRQSSLGYGFQHVTSSPHFPQNNEFAESLVCTAKATLKKCTLGKCDPDLAFLLLHSTPVSTSLPSPAELLYNRPVRSVLPSATKYRPELKVQSLCLL